MVVINNTPKIPAMIAPVMSGPVAFVCEIRNAMQIPGKAACAIASPNKLCSFKTA